MGMFWKEQGKRIPTPFAGCFNRAIGCYVLSGWIKAVELAVRESSPLLIGDTPYPLYYIKGGGGICGRDVF